MSIQFGRYIPVPANPLTILGSLAWWVRADQGVTIATGVSQWNDLSGNGINFVQGTGSQQPLFVSSAINGQPAIRSDGVNDVMGATWARVAPGTQPFYIWVICNQVSFTSGRTIIGDYTTPNGFIWDQNASAPNIRMYNVSNGPSTNGATVGSYFRIESQYTNSTSDYIKAGATSATGINSGNLVGGGTVQLFKGGTSSGVGANVEIAEAFAFLGTPTSPQRADLDAYCTARYGVGLV